MIIGGVLMTNSTTEKITTNINVVDLAYIDLLVSEGYYATRTEFIKTAIKSQLDKHEGDKERLFDQNKELGYELLVGIVGITQKKLELLLAAKKKIKLVSFGVFIIPSSIPNELVMQTIEELKVYGVCKCSEELKEFYHI